MHDHDDDYLDGFLDGFIWFFNPKGWLQWLLYVAIIIGGAVYLSSCTTQRAAAPAAYTHQTLHAEPHGSRIR